MSVILFQQITIILIINNYKKKTGLLGSYLDTLMYIFKLLLGTWTSYMSRISRTQIGQVKNNIMMIIVSTYKFNYCYFFSLNKTDNDNSNITDKRNNQIKFKNVFIPNKNT